MVGHEARGRVGEGPFFSLSPGGRELERGGLVSIFSPSPCPSPIEGEGNSVALTPSYTGGHGGPPLPCGGLTHHSLRQKIKRYRQDDVDR